MYVSSRQGYKPPVKSTGKVKEYTHFASLKYCNGAETFYTYDPQRRRLQNLTVNSGGNTIMDNAYTYDANSKYINKKNKHSHQKKLQPSHENLFVQPLQYLTVGQKTSLIEM